jgi:receptor protein-tyrosine kinase
VSDVSAIAAPTTDPAATGGGRTGLRQALVILRRRWWILVAAVVAVVAVALAQSLTQQKQYTATAALLFQNTGLDQAFFGSPALTPSNDAQQEANTNTQLASLDAIGGIASPTLRKQGIHIDAANVHNAVAVEQAGQSNVVNLVATMPTPNQAADVANAYANAYVAFRRQRDQAKVQQAIQLVQQQIAQLPANHPRVAQLTHDVSQLEVLKALQTGNAEVVQTATPPSGPSAPRIKRSAAIGALLGLLLALILIVERLDRRVRDVDELQDIFQKPVLAAIPADPQLAVSKMGKSTGTRASALEPFRILRANLAYFRVGRERRSLIVASGSPGEGKTTVAVNLAVAAALGGQRVILLEADLRRPSLMRHLGLAGARQGLAEVLSGQVRLKDVVVGVPLAELAGGPEEAYLDVLLAGATPPNPAELVESDDMARLLEELEQRYDLVVIDTPPITVVSDALLLLNRGQGVVIVARLNQTTRDSAARLRDQLKTIGVAPLGIVANAISQRSAGYYYYAGYSYGSPNGGKIREPTQQAAEPAGVDDS